MKKAWKLLERFLVKKLLSLNSKTAWKWIELWVLFATGTIIFRAIENFPLKLRLKMTWKRLENDLNVFLYKIFFIWTVERQKNELNCQFYLQLEQLPSKLLYIYCRIKIENDLEKAWKWIEELFRKTAHFWTDKDLVTIHFLNIHLNILLNQ